MEDKITLDLNSFKALASETRVDLLKKLSLRRATASELAASEHISVQAISEHLEKMKDAGLVRKVDEGRKWIYYELTDKGSVLLKPEENSKKIFVLLSIAALLLASGAFIIYSTIPTYSPYFTSNLERGFGKTIQSEGVGSGNDDGNSAYNILNTPSIQQNTGDLPKYTQAIQPEAKPLLSASNQTNSNANNKTT